MRRATQLAHDLVRAVVRSGDCAVDATLGNGHDAIFLALLAGPQGKVCAFDIQEEACRAARQRWDAIPEPRAPLAIFHAGHECMNQFLPREFSGNCGAVMFNLGYLPGGDKSLVTQPHTTLAALEAALPLLRPGGILTIVGYPGHPGGKVESEAVERWVREVPDPPFAWTIHRDPAAVATAPFVMAVQRHAGPDQNF
jgi:SAM-dependent methyltransferase